jgi:hypothetical protein
MKSITGIIVLLLALALQAGAQELRGVQLELTVSNGAGLEQTLTVGVYEGATPGLDPLLGESELPPQPPNEIFDVRCISTPGVSQLGTGSLADFRPPATGTNEFSQRYTLAYQAGIGASSVTLSWYEPLPGRITRLLIDGVDMQGQTELESEFATGQFSVEVSYDMSPLGFTATPASLMFEVNDRDPLPSQMLTITPTGDRQALWVLSTDIDWLDLEMMSGEGEQQLTVAVNTRLLPAGSYEGTIDVRTMNYPAYLEIPVRMRMVVGIPLLPAAADIWLGYNYPNPFNPTTSIDVDLGVAGHAAVPRFIVRDILGREVADLSSAVRPVSGLQTVIFDADALPGGVYTYSLYYGNAVRTRSMIVLK